MRKRARGVPAIRMTGAIALAAVLVQMAASRPVFTQNRAAQTSSLLTSLRSARIVELNFVCGQSVAAARPQPAIRSLARRHHKSTAGMIPGIAFAGDMMYFSGQHGSPTIDALGHVSSNGKLYGGIDAVASEGAQGLLKLGIEGYPREKFVNRGVLLDIPRFKRVESLAPGQEVTGEDMELTAKAQGVEIRAGDSVLIRTGYGKLFSADKPKMHGTAAGHR